MLQLAHFTIHQPTPDFVIQYLEIYIDHQNMYNGNYRYPVSDITGCWSNHDLRRQDVFKAFDAMHKLPATLCNWYKYHKQPMPRTITLRHLKALAYLPIDINPAYSVAVLEALQTSETLASIPYRRSPYQSSALPDTPPAQDARESQWDRSGYTVCSDVLRLIKATHQRLAYGIAFGCDAELRKLSVLVRGAWLFPDFPARAGSEALPVVAYDRAFQATDEIDAIFKATKAELRRFIERYNGVGNYTNTLIDRRFQSWLNEKDTVAALAEEVGKLNISAVIKRSLETTLKAKIKHLLAPVLAQQSQPSWHEIAAFPPAVKPVQATVHEDPFMPYMPAPYLDEELRRETLQQTLATGNRMGIATAIARSIPPEQVYYRPPNPAANWPSPTGRVSAATPNLQRIGPLTGLAAQDIENLRHAVRLTSQQLHEHLRTAHAMSEESMSLRRFYNTIRHFQDPSINQGMRVEMYPAPNVIMQQDMETIKELSTRMMQDALIYNMRYELQCGNTILDFRMNVSRHREVKERMKLVMPCLDFMREEISVDSYVLHRPGYIPPQSIVHALSLYTAAPAETRYNTLRHLAGLVPIPTRSRFEDLQF